MTPSFYNCTTTCYHCGGQQTNFIVFDEKKNRNHYKKPCIHCKRQQFIEHKTIVYDNNRNISNNK